LSTTLWREESGPPSVANAREPFVEKPQATRVDPRRLLPNDPADFIRRNGPEEVGEDRQVHALPLEGELQMAP
jgi:hypothetical protein